MKRLVIVAAVLGVGAVAYGLAFQEVTILSIGAVVTATTLIGVIVLIVVVLIQKSSLV